MNFSQLHERLRVEVLRRIERQVITASHLARRAGLSQPLISNFLRSQRRLGPDNFDRVLAALDLSVERLGADAPPSAAAAGGPSIPLVTQHVAIFEDRIHPTSVLDRVALPESILARPPRPARRATRERFVAVAVTPAQAAPMDPVLLPGSVLVLDRHAGLPTPSDVRGVYAVVRLGQLRFAYLSLERSLFVLRAHAPMFPVELVPVPPNMAASELVIGRVVVVCAPHPAAGAEP